MKSVFLAWIPMTLLAPSLWAAGSAYHVSGTVKTVEKEKSGRRDMPRGDVQTEVRTKVLEMSVRRTNPTVGGNATVEWVVILEQPNGKSKLGTHGSRPLHTNVGVPVEITSDPFSLWEGTFRGDGRVGDASREQEVKGYAIRVVDAEGGELGVKFQPASVEEDARKAFEWAAAQRAGGDGKPKAEAKEEGAGRPPVPDRDSRRRRWMLRQ